MGSSMVQQGFRASAPSSEPRRDSSRQLRARDLAIAFLRGQDLPGRRSADGHPVGIQATVATGGGLVDGMDLYAVMDAMVAGPSASDDAFGDDPNREAWREIISMVERKLGFPLEPELFSNMLFVAHLGGERHPDLRAINQVLLETFRDREADGLYHFFASLQFACDIDCTGMAARARIVSGDIDPATEAGASSLRRITSAILRSAAVANVPREKNLTHGKENGPLVQHVFKVYLDDHRTQGPECDRGLKINPVVVSNALYPVLVELKRGLRAPDEIIALREFVEGSAEPRTGEASVAEIVSANVCYATGYLVSGEWREGCRYYPSPDAFLCFFSENLREFPELFEAFGATQAMKTAIHERRVAARSEPATDPTASLNTAFRAIAALNLGIDASPELEQLVARQDPSGAWTDPDCMYSFGSNTSIPVHFRSNLLTTAFAIRALTLDGRPWTTQAAASPTWANPIIERVLHSVL
jgi:hypothetical protein